MSFEGAVVIDVSEEDRVALDKFLEEVDGWMNDIQGQFIEGNLITTTYHWGFWKEYGYEKERIEEQYPDFFEWLHVSHSRTDKTCFSVGSYGKIPRLTEIQVLLSVGSELFLTPSQAHVWAIFKNLKEPVE